MLRLIGYLRTERYFVIITKQISIFAAELMVDKAMELRYIGGIYGGNIKVTPFLCLVLKLLQIQPEKDIVVEFISQQDCKFV